jgi:regulator of nucleoside diphosphate kinase
MKDAAKLYLTEEDYEVLEAVAERYSKSLQLDFLENELARAEVVAQKDIPNNVVTLHSRVRVVDESTGMERELTVVPPGGSDGVSEGKVTVLSPIGAAVIGLSEGQAIDWLMPSGRSRRFRVAKVLYQPESAERLGRNE